MEVNIKGLQLNYKVSGEGQDMVLLHGWGASIKAFDTVHDYYDKYFRVYTIDFPGFGDSEEPTSVWGVDEYSDHFCEFIEKMKITNPIVMGHSFGGRVAIRSSARVPYHKLILVDSAGIKPKRSMKYYIKVYSFKLVKKLAKLPVLQNILTPKIESYRAKVGSSDYNSASPKMRGILSKVVNQDLKKYLQDIKAPTLLVWGNQDKTTPLSDAKIMEKMISDAGLVVFEGAGHFSYLDAFPKFIRVINSFLAKEMERKNAN